MVAEGLHDCDDLGEEDRGRREWEERLRKKCGVESPELQDRIMENNNNSNKNVKNLLFLK